MSQQTNTQEKKGLTGLGLSSIIKSSSEFANNKRIKQIPREINSINLIGLLVDHYLIKSKEDSQSDRGSLSKPREASTGYKSLHYCLMIKPTNVTKLIQEWVDAPIEERINLPYVPVFLPNEPPTIAMCLTSEWTKQKKPTKIVHSFMLPITNNRRDHWIQEGVIKRVSYFGNIPTFVINGRGLIELTSVHFSPNGIRIPPVKNTTLTLDKIAFGAGTWSYKTEIEDEFYEVKLYFSCRGMTQHRHVHLDGMPREYAIQATAFNPCFQEISMERVAWSKDKEKNPDAFNYPYFWLTVGKNYGSGAPSIVSTLDLTYEMVTREKIVEGENVKEIGYIIKDDEVELSPAGMIYGSSFFKVIPGSTTGDTYPETDPSCYIYNQTKNIVQNVDTKKKYVNTQIKFAQWTNDEEKYMDPSFPIEEHGSSTIRTQSGTIKVALFDSVIDHCGITSNREWSAMMARLPIPVTFLGQIKNDNPKDKDKKSESTFETAKEDSGALGLFEMTGRLGVWHVIEFTRLYGIPVTPEWVKATIDTAASPEIREKYCFEVNPACIQGSPIVNNMKGEHYGFFNLSEMGNSQKHFLESKIFVKDSGWNFSVISDYQYQRLASDVKKALGTFTPEEGVDLLLGNSIRDGRLRADFGGLNCGSGGGGIIIAYRYNPEWPKLIANYKAKRCLELSNWRKILNDPENLAILEAATDYATKRYTATEIHDSIVKICPSDTFATTEKDVLKDKKFQFDFDVQKKVKSFTDPLADNSSQPAPNTQADLSSQTTSNMDIDNSNTSDTSADSKKLDVSNNNSSLRNSDSQLPTPQPVDPPKAKLGLNFPTKRKDSALTLPPNKKQKNQ
jgi:hypothetical protein